MAPTEPFAVKNQKSEKPLAQEKCLPLIRGREAGKIAFQALARGHYPGKKLGRGSLTGLKTAGFWDASHIQDWGLNWHQDEGLEITFLESGSIHFAVDETECQLQPDDLTFTRPWQRHRLGNPFIGAGRLHWMILDVGATRPHQDWRWPTWLVLTPADLRQLTKFLRQNEQPVWRANSEFRRLYQKIALAVIGEDVSRLTVFLNELFLLLLDMFRHEKVPLDESLSSARRTVELFWNRLRQNGEYLNSELSVALMARRCGMGVTHFIDQTKQLVNMTPGNYLTRCRLEAAAKMLRDGPEMNVTEIALRAGFSSSQYFATQFRRQFGCTPRDYRLT